MPRPYLPAMDGSALSKILSNAEQLQRMRAILSKYASLPFSPDTIPGAVMEAVLANVRDAEVLKTYDFVDVIDRKNRVGWQVKSTKASTPVTWKRAKIPDRDVMIAVSRESQDGVRALGDRIIDFCNDHAIESMRLYGLDEIGYARLIVHNDGGVSYFERLLCTKDEPLVFRKEDFEWAWSQPKVTTKKEQLPAFHGRHTPTGRKWWAWHGLGENQLHFSGEGTWWPDDEAQMTRFVLAEDERMSLETFISLLERAPTESEAKTAAAT